MRRAILFTVLTTVLVATMSQARTYRGREVPDPLPQHRGGTTNISDINQNNPDGTSPLEFFPVTIEGVAQSGLGDLDPFDGVNASTWYYVADGTGGIAILHQGATGTPVAAGDSVRIDTYVQTYLVAPLQGTRTLDLGFFGGTVTVLGSGVGLAAAVPVTATELATNGTAYEGSRVRLTNVTLVDSTEWPGIGSSAFVRLTNGVDSVLAHIDDETDLGSATNLPQGPFDFIGFVAQNDPTAGGSGFLNLDHWLYPSGIADLIPLDGSGFVSVAPDTVAQGGSAQTLDFTVTGQDSTITDVEIVIPADWTWTNTSDVTLSGGFSGATTTTRMDGADLVLEIAGAAVTSGNPGTVSLGSMDVSPNVGNARFTSRTGRAAGPITEVVRSPEIFVELVVGSGAVLVNEVFPHTRSGVQSDEPAEFIELFNTTSISLDIGGWRLTDIGRDTTCTADSRWAFPTGTTIPADGYLLVCRSGFGFNALFPSLPGGVPVLEMYDPVPTGDTDDPSVPNMTLLDPTPEDDQIALLGGPLTNQGQCEYPPGSGQYVPYAELIDLRSTSGARVDHIVYQNFGPCEGEFCADIIPSPGDSYFYGPPKVSHTLGRDDASRDTGISRLDLIPSSYPTPGAVNIPVDDQPPAIINQAALSGSIFDVTFDELVVDSTASNPGSYVLSSTATADTFEVQSVHPDPEQPSRRYVLIAERAPAGTPLQVSANGVSDLLINGTGGNSANVTVPIPVPANARPICEIQEFDDLGFSPYAGEDVIIAGFVTVGDIPGVTPGESPPTDRISIWLQEPDGCGVNVFAFLGDDPVEYETEYPDVRLNGIRVNDLAQVRGRVTEFVSSSGSGAVTEVVEAGTSPFYSFLLRGLAGPDPVVVGTAAVNDESLEGTLVQTEGTVTEGNDLALYIDDGTGPVQVFQNFSSLDLTQFTVGQRLEVTGIITQFDSAPPYFSGYELVPQFQEAIVVVDGAFVAGDPVVRVDRRVLVPDLGEKINIHTASPVRTKVIIQIYDAPGRLVRTLYDGVGLGSVTVEWNGTDDRGSFVEPGMYVCHMRSVPLDGGRIRTATAPIVVGLRLKGWGVQE